MDRFTGIIGIVLILGIAFLFSNNKKRINLRLVCSGLALQLLIAILVLKVPAVNQFFQYLGKGMQKLEGFAKEGAGFVYGGIGAFNPAGQLVNYGAAPVFVFAFNIFNKFNVSFHFFFKKLSGALSVVFYKINNAP